MKKKAKKANLFKNIYLYFKENPLTILLVGIIALAFFIRIYEIETKSPFGWDQVDNAWAAKNIIVDNNFPLVGMQAKGNSGIFIGPFYYYLVAIFYFMTNLDPIASGLIAGATSLFGLIVIYLVAKKIFSRGVGIIAVTINGFFFLPILAERVQWPVNFIPLIGLLIFFSLYQISIGKSKYILLLALVFGFSLHIHFTSIYYPLIVLLALPMFPRTKETLKHILIGILIFIPFIIPIVVALINNAQGITNVSSYGNNYFHGLHLRRVLQLAGDAFLQFSPFIRYSELNFLKFILLPLFLITYLYRNMTKERMILSYLVIIFYLVPWIVMSTYSGEISDYYFGINRFISLLVISYLVYRIFILRNIIIKAGVILALIVLSTLNLNEFMQYKMETTLDERRTKILDKIERGEKVQFQEGVPESYLYYYYLRKEKKNTD